MLDVVFWVWQDMVSSLKELPNSIANTLAAYRRSWNNLTAFLVNLSTSFHLCFIWYQDEECATFNNKDHYNIAFKYYDNGNLLWVSLAWIQF